MPVPAENQAGEHPQEAQNQKKSGGPGALSRAEQEGPEGLRPQPGGQGLKDLVHQKPAQQVAHRDGKKLQGIPGGVYPPLELHRHPVTDQNIQIRVHHRDSHPA